MKRSFVFLLLAIATAGYSQDFLGQWSVVKIFTTANYQKEDDGRMLLLIHQAIVSDSKIDGVILPVKTVVEFSINPNNQSQHVTLSSDGLLLLSMNWKLRDPVPAPVDPSDPVLQAWIEGEAEYDLYTILYVDAKTLIFSDRSRTGSRFLDIYYLEKKD